MAVIKHNTPAASSAKPFSMADIESYARTMLLRARQDADQLLAAAQTEGEALKAQAHAEGLAQGKKEGLAQGKAEGSTAGKAQAFEAEKKKLAELITTMNQTITSLDAHRRELIDRAEAEVLPLALAIARKVTKRLGALDPRVVEANVREAVRLVATKHDIHVSVHPSQKHLMGDISTRLKQHWPQLQHVAIVEDAHIDPGGCRVATAQGEIDAELGTQLDRIAMELVPDLKPASPTKEE